MAFLIGWLVGLTAVSVVVLAIGLEGSDGDSDSGGWLGGNSDPRQNDVDEGANTARPGQRAPADGLCGASTSYFVALRRRVAGPIAHPALEELEAD